MIGFIYKIVFAVFAIAVGVLFVAGMLTGWTLYVAGVTAFGLIYFGMMFVLPFNITHGGLANAEKPHVRAEIKKVRESWRPTDIAMQQLKYH